MKFQQVRNTNTDQIQIRERKNPSNQREKEPIRSDSDQREKDLGHCDPCDHASPALGRLDVQARPRRPRLDVLGRRLLL